MIKQKDYYQVCSDIGFLYLPLTGVPKILLSDPCLSIILAMEREGWSFYMLTVIKYLYRAGIKGNAIEDLEKACGYLQLEQDRRTQIWAWLPEFVTKWIYAVRIAKLVHARSSIREHIFLLEMAGEVVADVDEYELNWSADHTSP